jgi:putative acetyltransferase
MTSDIEIRNETSDDIAAIAEVTIATFRDLEISNHAEHFINDAVRAAAALALSLVAVV